MRQRVNLPRKIFDQTLSSSSSGIVLLRKTIRDRCKGGGGGSICEHKRQRSKCKECAHKDEDGVAPIEPPPPRARALCPCRINTKRGIGCYSTLVSSEIRVRSSTACFRSILVKRLSRYHDIERDGADDACDAPQACRVSLLPSPLQRIGPRNCIAEYRSMILHHMANPVRQ